MMDISEQSPLLISSRWAKIHRFLGALKYMLVAAEGSPGVVAVCGCLVRLKSSSLMQFMQAWHYGHPSLPAQVLIRAFPALAPVILFSDLALSLLTKSLVHQVRIYKLASSSPASLSSREG